MGDTTPFLSALSLKTGDTAALVGAGGKTSLMFRLAQEAASIGMRVLVTTSTRIALPGPGEYDYLDLSGRLFTEAQPREAGVYVGGIPDGSNANKIMGVREDLLSWQRRAFDLILVEADGAACKPLKGWREDEPVIPEITSVTIGILDIQTIGRPFSEEIVHRAEEFSLLTGADPGETLSLGHLLRLTVHDNGLFRRTLGREILFINKVESQRDRSNSELLKSQLDAIEVVAGSLMLGEIHG